MPDSAAPTPRPNEPDLVWPADGLSVIPDWVYTSEAIYQREVERIFRGRTWNFVALECELPEPGSFKRSFVGPTPVIVTRDAEGNFHCFENRCAHRGAELCRPASGKATELVCPYHQWTYDLAGNLTAVPFRRGVQKQGGMPADFKLSDHNLLKLATTTRRGVVFASFHHDMESFEDYVGPEILKDFDATFDGRKLTLLGYYRNTVPANWKMYHENLKDPYHATLLHAFLVNFGLMVAGNKSGMIVDASGRHGTLASAKPDKPQVDEASKKEMRTYSDTMKLADGRMLDYVREFDSPWSVTMQTIWPNLIVQRELNTLGIRHIVPQGPDAFLMIWVMFGYEGDSEEMTRHRLRQGNLMGPSGFLGLEDNEALKFVQQGVERSVSDTSYVGLGGTEEGTAYHIVTESAIRSLYRHYRSVMEL
ncbi:MAG: aromatic ring-hydroxylating dioxygenase subunit alpha [Alphaproteobacteria bacterium]|nr:aromatic ring-hydroxylating dioxygenase subunit alpha [Alphaproteobacteria bacterium]